VVVKTARLRARADPASKACGELVAGTKHKALEEQILPDGRQRLGFAKGWASPISASGEELLRNVEHRALTQGRGRARTKNLTVTAVQTIDILKERLRLRDDYLWLPMTSDASNEKAQAAGAVLILKHMHDELTAIAATASQEVKTALRQDAELVDRSLQSVHDEGLKRRAVVEEDEQQEHKTQRLELTVKVLQARGLPATNGSGSCDSYCVLHVPGHVLERTQVSPCCCLFLQDLCC